MSKYNKIISQSVDMLGERGNSLMTSDSHIQIKNELQKVKNEYLKSVDINDKTGTQKSFNLMQKMSQGVAKWQAIGNQVPGISNKIGFSKGMTEEEASTIAGITSMQDSKLHVDHKTGDVLIDIPLLGAGRSRFSASQYDSLISRNVAPATFTRDILERGGTMYGAGKKGDNEFSYGSVYSENKSKVEGEDSPGIPSFLNDDIIPGKPNIKKQILDHPELKEYSPEIRQSIVESLTLPEQKEMAVELIATALTGYDQERFTGGQKAFKENNKILSEASTNKEEAPKRKASIRQRVGSAISRFMQGKTDWTPAVDALKNK